MSSDTVHEPSASTEAVLAALRTMCVIREFETRANQLFNEKEIRGAVHASSGQEAVAVAVAGGLRNDDLLASTHRGHGHAIAKGASVNALMAELMGRATGACGGKGGSMHVTDASVGLLGANGIVGASVELATGAALTCQVLGRGSIAVAMFGDGAVAQGSFHEAMNLAALWKLPLVFVCENNQYAVSMHSRDSIANERISNFAQVYGIPGRTVDGMSVDEVAEAFAHAVTRARNGDGPSLIEAQTYRFLGHSRGDPPHGTYRTKEEFEHWQSRDPIPAYALARGLSPEQVTEVQEAARVIVDEAVEFGRNSPLPDPADALRGLFVEAHDA